MLGRSWSQQTLMHSNNRGETQRLVYMTKPSSSSSSCLGFCCGPNAGVLIADTNKPSPGLPGSAALPPFCSSSCFQSSLVRRSKPSVEVLSSPSSLSSTLCRTLFFRARAALERQNGIIREQLHPRWVCAKFSHLFSLTSRFTLPLLLQMLSQFAFTFRPAHSRAQMSLSRVVSTTHKSHNQPEFLLALVEFFHDSVHGFIRINFNALHNHHEHQ